MKLLQERYRRYRIGKSTVADETIHIPKQVIENYALKKGDIWEFYPPDVNFPDEESDNLIAILIVRATEMATVTIGR